jgi:hypothetical protein
MTLRTTTLDLAISKSHLGRYELVQLALEWFDILKRSDKNKKLTQIEIINKVLEDVLSESVTRDSLIEIYEDQKTKKKI